MTCNLVEETEFQSFPGPISQDIGHLIIISFCLSLVARGHTIFVLHIFNLFFYSRTLLQLFLMATVFFISKQGFWKNNIEI